MKKLFGYRIFALIGVLACFGLVALGVVNLANGPLKNFSIPLDGDPKFSEKQILSRDIEPFKTLRLKGAVNVRIVKGKPGLVYYGNKADPALMEFNQSGDVLELSAEKNFFLDARIPAVQISVENFETLEFKGAGNLRLTDMTLPTLHLKADGALNVVISGLVIQDFSITLNGAANIDASSSWILNAVLDVDGMSNLKIGMNGGELKGRIKGLSNLSWYGPVSSNSVDIKECLGTVKQLSETPLNAQPFSLGDSKKQSDTKE